LSLVKRDGRIEIVILDFDLIDRPGFSLIEQIHRCSGVPIIVLSDKEDEPTVLKAFNMGADEYIVKPVNKSVLMARIKAIIRKKRFVEFKSRKG
jgi:two-component system KDP operon response regulator KdpE